MADNGGYCVNAVAATREEAGRQAGRCEREGHVDASKARVQPSPMRSEGLLKARSDGRKEGSMRCATGGSTMGERADMMVMNLD